MEKPMDRIDRKSLALKASAAYMLGLAALGCALFIPAGTLDYWQGRVFICIIFSMHLTGLIYFLVHDPGIVARRLMFIERSRVQRRIMLFVRFFQVILMLIPGFDFRFRWSQVPPAQTFIADGFLFIGCILYFWVVHTNSYASKIIRVEKGQKVITSGPYALVRHPFYDAMGIITLSLPIALGSYWAYLPMIPLLFLLVLRILDEERLLNKELAGYAEYCKKTRSRLIPHVW